MQIEYPTLIFGLITLVMFGLVGFLLGRGSPSRPYVEREFGNNEPAIGPRFGGAVRASIIGTAIYGLFWVLYQSHPWTDRHDHTFFQMIGCDILALSHATCEPAEATILVAPPPPIQADEVGDMSTADNEDSSDSAIEVPPADPAGAAPPENLLPPAYGDLDDGSESEIMTFEQGIDAFEDSPIQPD